MAKANAQPQAQPATKSRIDRVTTNYRVYFTTGKSVVVEAESVENAIKKAENMS
jgi:hypothetical protein